MQNQRSYAFAGVLLSAGLFLGAPAVADVQMSLIDAGDRANGFDVLKEYTAGIGAGIAETGVIDPELQDRLDAVLADVPADLRSILAPVYDRGYEKGASGEYTEETLAAYVDMVEIPEADFAPLGKEAHQALLQSYSLDNTDAAVWGALRAAVVGVDEVSGPDEANALFSAVVAGVSHVELRGHYQVMDDVQVQGDAEGGLPLPEVSFGEFLRLMQDTPRMGVDLPQDALTPFDAFRERATEILAERRELEFVGVDY